MSPRGGGGVYCHMPGIYSSRPVLQEWRHVLALRCTLSVVTQAQPKAGAARSKGIR